jgi:hypothetical protein
MTVEELRAELLAILALEEQSPTDWEQVEARCEGVVERLNKEVEGHRTRLTWCITTLKTPTLAKNRLVIVICSGNVFESGFSISNVRFGSKGAISALAWRHPIAYQSRAGLGQGLDRSETAIFSRAW